MAPTPEEAMRGIHKTVTDVVKDMEANGEHVMGTGGTVIGCDKENRFVMVF